jgi:hypothetical protein
MIDNAEIIRFSIDVTIKFRCPHCKTEDVIIYAGSSPHRSESSDPMDTQCKNCKEFLTLQL